MITGDQKQEYLDFFNEILGVDIALDDISMMTHLDKIGKPLAVAGFTNLTGYNVEISLAARPKWTATKRFILACCYHAFIVEKVWRITSYVEVGNQRSINFHKRLGAQQELGGLVKNWFGEKDGLQFVMFKKDCQWLRGFK